MKLRLLLLLFGLVELLFPRRVVDFWMGVATAPDSDVELRPWVYTVARLEGLAFVLWGLSRARGKEETAPK